MADRKPEVRRPNRDKPESKQTKAIVSFLLVVSAGLVAVITIGGWDKLEGGQTVNVAYVVVYLLFAFYVSRWNRGVLPVSSALAVILIIFAAVAAPAWFGRDKAGFDDPTLPESVLGLLTLVLIPVQALLIAFAMRGFRQQWNVEAGSRAAMDAGMGPPEPSAETRA
jgi:presenilin-like A22 family membrane protease